MNKLPCPHCQAKVVPGLTKLTLGPGRTISCSSCGGDISVPWTSLLLLVPVAGALGMANTANSLAIKAAVWAVMLVLVALIVQFLIPLQARRR